MYLNCDELDKSLNLYLPPDSLYSVCGCHILIKRKNVLSINYISIDVTKFNHWISVTNTDGEVLLKPYKIFKNRNGFDLLISQIESFKKPRHIVGLEATGHYGDNLIFFLLDHDYQVSLITPISTDTKRKEKIRKTKNDRIDTFITAQIMQSTNYTLITERKLEMCEMK